MVVAPGIILLILILYFDLWPVSVDPLAYQAPGIDQSSLAFQNNRTQAKLQPINFADDVAIAPYGSVYFTEATTRFPAHEYGLLKAANLDLIAHRPKAKVGVCNPATGPDQIAG